MHFSILFYDDTSIFKCLSIKYVELKVFTKGHFLCFLKINDFEIRSYICMFKSTFYITQHDM